MMIRPSTLKSLWREKVEKSLQENAVAALAETAADWQASHYDYVVDSILSILREADVGENLCRQVGETFFYAHPCPEMETRDLLAGYRGVLEEIDDIKPALEKVIGRGLNDDDEDDDDEPPKRLTKAKKKPRTKKAAGAKKR